jgi:hypothetical protein
MDDDDTILVCDIDPYKHLNHLGFGAFGYVDKVFPGQFLVSSHLNGGVKACILCGREIDYQSEIKL